MEVSRDNDQKRKESPYLEMSRDWPKKKRLKATVSSP